jgi:hypothetical protein
MGRQTAPHLNERKPELAVLRSRRMMFPACRSVAQRRFAARNLVRILRAAPARTPPMGDTRTCRMVSRLLRTAFRTVRRDLPPR